MPGGHSAGDRAVAAASLGTGDMGRVSHRPALPSALIASISHGKWPVGRNYRSLILLIALRCAGHLPAPRGGAARGAPRCVRCSFPGRWSGWGSCGRERRMPSAPCPVPGGEARPGPVGAGAGSEVPDPSPCPA